MEPTTTETVVENPTPTKPAAPPPGPGTLPAGVTRRVRANRDWLYAPSEHGAALVSEGGGPTTEYREVEILGPCRMCAGEAFDDACGYTRKLIWIETEAEIRVK